MLYRKGWRSLLSIARCRAGGGCLEKGTTNKSNWNEINFSKVCWFSFIWSWGTSRFQRVYEKLGSNCILSSWNGGSSLVTSRCWPKLLVTCHLLGQRKSSWYYFYSTQLKFGCLRPRNTRKYSNIFEKLLDNKNTEHHLELCLIKKTLAKNESSRRYFASQAPCQRVERESSMRRLGGGTHKGNLPSCLCVADTVAFRVQGNFFQTFSTSYLGIRFLFHGGRS
jgi:hypothetical protein